MTTRRSFLTLLGGATAAWPKGAWAQQRERMRLIGVLTPLTLDDPEHLARVAALTQGLQERGWIAGRNLKIEARSGSDAAGLRRSAAGLVSLASEVILVTGGSALGPALDITRTVPIVFTQTPDPVGAGFVASLSRPGGNATGFTLFEYETSGKWLELLKEIAPWVTRAAILRDPSIPQGVGQLAAIQSAAQTLRMEATPVSLRDANEIERAITLFAGRHDGGMIVTASGLSNVHREAIIELAARYRLPAVYFHRLFAPRGGLICYGPDSIDPHRRAAEYIDRILKGDKPADLPVQAPTKYELVINLKTARALGITVPATLLARADEVIE
jgi:putative ABC transport system substrate-binding protein